MDKKPPLLCLMGPTASGKTDLAVTLVQRFPFDIISVDSAMVYRGLDIGAAKPGAETLRIAPHRLIDIRDPAQAYSAAEFRDDALREIENIHASGRIPLLVGGTMLYFRALLNGLAPLPAASPAIRRKLEAERETYGNAILHQRLSRLDPAAAARIHPNDPQRVQRALEVFELTGRPLSELQAEAAVEAMPLRCLKLALMPPNRAWLHERIAQRFNTMLRTGLLDEVAGLRARPDLNLAKPALRAVGYRQVWRYLSGEIDYDEMLAQGISATRQFAKRQMTWLRAEPNIKRLDSSRPQYVQEVINYLNENHFLKT